MPPSTADRWIQRTALAALLAVMTALISMGAVLYAHPTHASGVTTTSHE